MDWVVKKSGPLSKELNKVDEAKSFIEDSQIAVVGFFTNLDSELRKVFTHITEDVDEVEFGITSNPDVLAHYEITENTILMFKKVCDFSNVSAIAHNMFFCTGRRGASQI